MKREKIYVAAIIDTISSKYNCDKAYIFNTEKEALDWAEDIKKSMEDMGCPLCENQLFIQKVDTSIDEYKAEIERLRTTLRQCNTELNSALESLKSQCREIGELKAKIKQAQIDVLNKLKDKMFEREYMGVKYKERIFYESEIDDMIAEVQNAEDKG